MLTAFAFFLRRCLLLPLEVVYSVNADGWRYLLKRLLVSVVALPLLVALQCLHWLGFFLDELFFRGYRRLTIKQPIFVIGVPRSGTTFLQRALATDRRLTTTRTWECLLAPSISERYFWSGVGRLLQPLRRLSWQRLAFFRRMGAIHPLGLDKAEEDFLLLLPTLSCFIQVVLLPGSIWLWQLGRFDTALPPQTRRLLINYYRRCVQKHLYFHGPELRYLAKNPSFSGWPLALAEAFPDAVFLVCDRPPTTVVASQLSSLRPALGLIGSRRPGTVFTERLLSLLTFYYCHLGQALLKLPGTALLVPNRQLRERPEHSMRRIYQHVGLTLDDKMAAAFTATGLAEAGSRRRHRYSLTDFGLDESQIARRFADVWPLAKERCL